MTAPVVPRLHAIVAAEARTAVVFRRGPTSHVRMLRWDLRTDPTLVADLCEQTFEKIPPPIEATRWPPAPKKKR